MEYLDFKRQVWFHSYGFIRMDTKIEPYDTKFKKPYNGDWPIEDSGYYLGGPLYFRNAPERFKPLVPIGTKYGEAVGYTYDLLERAKQIGFDKAYTEWTVPSGDCKDVTFKWGSGVVKEIYNVLLTMPVTKSELLEILAKKFPHRRRAALKITIDCQVRQTRMGKEREVTIHRDGNHFWLTPGISEPTKPTTGFISQMLRNNGV